jgi:hypothetical protein
VHAIIATTYVIDVLDPGEICLRRALPMLQGGVLHLHCATCTVLYQVQCKYSASTVLYQVQCSAVCSVQHAPGIVVIELHGLGEARTCDQPRTRSHAASQPCMHAVMTRTRLRPGNTGYMS